MDSIWYYLRFVCFVVALFFLFGLIPLVIYYAETFQEIRWYVHYINKKTGLYKKAYYRVNNWEKFEKSFFKFNVFQKLPNKQTYPEFFKFKAFRALMREIMQIREIVRYILILEGILLGLIVFFTLIIAVFY